MKNLEICFQCEQEDIILESGVCPHYEFMSDEDLQKHNKMLSKTFDSRFAPICFGLNFNVQQLQDNMKFTYIYNKIVSQEVFGIKDTLKPIDEYIEEIKKTCEYKKYVQRCEFYKRGKSEEASSVLKLLDNGHTYTDALNITLQQFHGVNKEDLENELDIYI